MRKTKIKYLGNILFPVYVGVIFSEKDYLHEMKRLGVKNYPDFHSSTASVKYFEKDDRTTFLICFDPIKFKNLHRNVTAAMLAHEAVHVADMTFRVIGEKHPGDEARAYLVQAVLQDTLFHMDEFLKKRKK